MADRVAEVEDGPQAGVPLVGGDDAALVAGTGVDQVGAVEDLTRPELQDLVPEVASGQQRGLHDLGHAGGQFGPRTGSRACRRR